METLERSVGNLIEADSFFVVSIKLLFVQEINFVRQWLNQKRLVLPFAQNYFLLSDRSLLYR